MAGFLTTVSKGVQMRYGNAPYLAKSAAEVPGLVEKYGVAVLPGVLTPEECTAFRDGMLEAAEHFTSNLEVPFDRARPETYGSIFKLAPNHGGLFQHHQWGHIQAVWDVRQNPKVAAAHAAFHGCRPEDLLTSFDGVNFSVGAMMPGKKRGQFRGNCWRHLDQRPSDSTKLCLQSWVTANPINPGDATLRFLEGGHNFHREFAEHFGLTENTVDWTKLTAEQAAWFESKGCEDTCVTAPAGAQVFWDSRVPHSGVEFLADEDRPGPEMPRSIRIVAYICYEPRNGPALPDGHPDTGKAEKGQAKNLAKRRRIFDPTDPWFLRITSHWPNKMKLFGAFPRSYGQKTLYKTDDPKTVHFVVDRKQTFAGEPLVFLDNGTSVLASDEGKNWRFSKDFWSFVPPIAGTPELTDFGRRIAGLD